MFDKALKIYLKKINKVGFSVSVDLFFSVFMKRSNHLTKLLSFNEKTSMKKFFPKNLIAFLLIIMLSD